jgi:hypothetical protein
MGCLRAAETRRQSSSSCSTAVQNEPRPIPNGTASCSDSASLPSPTRDVRSDVRARARHFLCELLVVVGDGVNDAGALAAATVGVAMHGGAEASLQRV